jgi:glyoxylase-like metal-dependent hydrolase (beta-lactamase superfamily II)
MATAIDISAIPGVHELALTRVRAHLVDGDRATLIDTGYAGSMGRISRALAGRGVGLAEVSRVICTHGHPDHAGSARALAELGIEILIHPADAEGMRTGWRAALRHPSRGRIFAAMTPPLDAFTPLRDGDVLPVLGGLEIIYTPGHTPGSVCLYGARDRVLFTGDVLERRFGRVSFASRLYSDDYRSARRTMGRLASLDVETIVFSHWPPLTRGAAATLAELAKRGST